MNMATASVGAFMDKGGARQNGAAEERRFLLDRIPDEDPDLRSGRSYADRVLDAWADMRWSTRSLIESRPSEGRLLFLALLSDVIFFLSRALSLVVAPPEEIGARLPDHVGFGLVLAFLVRTSFFYVAAAAAVIVSRPFGGRGSWYETRCAVFWAAFVSAPVEALGAAVTGVAVWAGAAEGWLAETPYFLGPIAFGFFLSAGVAEAQGFRYTYRVMAVTALLVVGLAVGALLLAGMQGA